MYFANKNYTVDKISTQVPSYRCDKVIERKKGMNRNQKKFDKNEKYALRHKIETKNTSPKLDEKIWPQAFEKPSCNCN